MKNNETLYSVGTMYLKIEGRPARYKYCQDCEIETENNYDVHSDLTIEELKFERDHVDCHMKRHLDHRWDNKKQKWKDI